jgi:hypothetical protein
MVRAAAICAMAMSETQLNPITPAIWPGGYSSGIPAFRSPTKIGSFEQGADLPSSKRSHCPQTGDAPVIAFSPEVIASHSLDELHCDADERARPTDAALELIPDTELAPTCFTSTARFCKQSCCCER